MRKARKLLKDVVNRMSIFSEGHPQQEDHCAKADANSKRKKCEIII